MQAGDFYFRPVFVSDGPAPARIGFLRRLLRKLFGPTEAQDVLSKMIYTIVISCPFCGLPIMTSEYQHITSKVPLTITEPIAYPYTSLSPTDAHSFRITDGNITAA